MIKVYNKNTSFIVIGDKYIAPFKSEEFEERNQVIRSLERSGIVSVSEVVPKNTNPTTPDLFNYEVEKAKEQEVKVVEEQPKTEEVEEIKEEAIVEEINEEAETVEETVVEEVEEPKKKTRKRKSK